MSRAPTVSHVSLDFWNTLVTANPAYGAARDAFLAQHFNLPDVKVREVYRRLKDNADAAAELEGIGLNSADTYEQFMTAMGRPGQDWFGVRRGLERLFYEHPPLVPEATVVALRRLQVAGIGLSIGSNTNFVRGAVLDDAILSRWGVIWDFQVFSDQIGCSKPHDHFWRVVTERAIAHTGAAPDNILHIGDNKICDGGCVDHGIQFAYTPNPQGLAAILDGVLTHECV